MSNESKRQNVRSRCEVVFRQVFGQPELIVSDVTTASDIPEWDSLTHISLILALEEAFEIQFTSDEVTSMSRVGDLFTVLDGKEEDSGRL